MEKSEKTSELIIDLKKAFDRLKIGYSAPLIHDLDQDGVIQRFEFTFELSWKLMQSILYDEGFSENGVKTIIRKAAHLKLLDDPQQWFFYLQKRNLATHTYDDELAKDVYISIKGFIPLVEDFIKNSEEHFL